MSIVFTHGLLVSQTSLWVVQCSLLGTAWHKLFFHYLHQEEDFAVYNIPWVKTSPEGHSKQRSEIKRPLSRSIPHLFFQKGGSHTSMSKSVVEMQVLLVLGYIHAHQAKWVLIFRLFDFIPLHVEQINLFFPWTSHHAWKTSTQETCMSFPVSGNGSGTMLCSFPHGDLVETSTFPSPFIGKNM